MEIRVGGRFIFAGLDLSIAVTSIAAISNGSSQMNKFYRQIARREKYFYEVKYPQSTINTYFDTHVYIMIMPYFYRIRIQALYNYGKTGKFPTRLAYQIIRKTLNKIDNQVVFYSLT